MSVVETARDAEQYSSTGFLLVRHLYHDFSRYDLRYDTPTEITVSQ